MKSYLSARRQRSLQVLAARSRRRVIFVAGGIAGGGAAGGPGPGLAARSRRRVIFVAGGIAVGAAAVALAQVSDWAQMIFADMLARSRYVSLVLTPLGLALSGFLTIRYFP